jgi:hypothetical protein
MPKVVVRKGYRCLPGKRRELLGALQRVDAVATAAGWPRGRYLFVETKAPGEPDLEVEFTFESYAEMEQLERRLREHMARAARDVGSAGQEFLLEPSATRYLLLLDEPTTRAAGGAPARPAVATAPPAAPPRAALPALASEPREIPETREPDEAREPPPPAQPVEPPLTPAQQRARQLAAARAVMESAERSAGVPTEKRASQRRLGPLSSDGPVEGDSARGRRPGPAAPDDEVLDASA